MSRPKVVLERTERSRIPTRGSPRRPVSQSSGTCLVCASDGDPDVEDTDVEDTDVDTNVRDTDGDLARKCGCDAAPGPIGAWMLALLLPLLWRRRR